MSVQPLESRIASLESSVEHLNGAFGQLDKRLGDLRSDVNQNFGRLESRLQWLAGIQMTSWLTLMLAIFFKH